MNKSTLKHSVDTHANTLSNVNEDNHIIDPEIGIYAISDAMGGAGLGTLASQLAITLLPQFLHATSLGTETTWPFEKKEGLSLEQNFLRMVFLQIHAKIIDRAKHEEHLGEMGCSLISAMVFENKVIVMSIGNCRAYVYQKNHLIQLTEDRSLAYYKKWLPLKPEHNLALNFLGKDAPLDIDSTSEKITKSGDLFILLSSGIMSSLSNDQILEIVQKNSSNINSLSKNFISLSSQKNPHVDHTALILTI